MRQYQVTLGLAFLSALSSFPAFAQPARQRPAPVIQPLQSGDIRADDPDVIARDGAVKTIAAGIVLAAANRAAHTDRNERLEARQTTTIAATPEFNHFFAAGRGDAVPDDREEQLQTFIEWQRKQR